MNPPCESPLLVWPLAPWAQGEQQSQEALGKLYEHLCGASVAFGLFSALKLPALEWLWGALERNPGLHFSVLVSVYPGAPVTQQDLEALRQAQARYSDQFSIRLLFEEQPQFRSSNFLCLQQSQTLQTVVYLGTPANFGHYGQSPNQLSALLEEQDALALKLKTWYEAAEQIAHPLTVELIQAYPVRELVPVPNERAAHWRDFLNRIAKPRSDAQGNPTATPAPNSPTQEKAAEEGTSAQATGDEVVAANPQPEEPQPDRFVILDSFEKEIWALYQKGKLVTVDKKSRIKPFSVPIKPEWIGLSQRDISGSVELSRSLKISPFNEENRKQLNHEREAPNRLFAEFTCTLADGVRWLPNSALGYFKLELEKAEAELKEQLKKIVSGDASKYLKGEDDRIKKDIEGLFQQLKIPYRNIEQEYSSGMAKIRQELRNRIDAALNADSGFQMSRNSITFDPRVGDGHTDPWIQAYTLLENIAKFPRNHLKSTQFPKEKWTLLKAMNVADDQIITGIAELSHCSPITVSNYAVEQLGEIERISECPKSPREKCQILWELLKRPIPSWVC